MIYAKIIFIRRNGTDGAYYPLTKRTCLIGRHEECDIPIQLREVADNHCQINVNEDGEISLTNLTGSSSSVSLNGSPVSNTVPLRHGDVFCIRKRSFRFEVQNPLQKNPSNISAISETELTGAITRINSSDDNHHSEGIPQTLVMENTEHRNIETWGNSINVTDGNNVEPGSSTSILRRLNSSGLQMFHLQRIGPPASKPGVADVMDFWKVTSLIGRKAMQIDFLIDSSDYVQGAYVSRLHARMVRRQNNIHRLFDDSLNGVFVNNFKISGHVDLQAGDRVTFGHPQGSKLPAGTRVHQPDSEYQFMFEICSCPPDYKPHHQEHNVAMVPSSFIVPCVPKSMTVKRCRNATQTFTQEDIATCQSQDAGTSLKVEMNEDISDQKHKSMFEYADKMQTEPVKKDDSLETGHDVVSNEVQQTGFSGSRIELDALHSSVERMAEGEVEHNRISFQATRDKRQEEAESEMGPSGSGQGSNEEQKVDHTGSVTCVATMNGNSVRVIDQGTVPTRAVHNEKKPSIAKNEEFIAEAFSQPGLEARICGGQLGNTGSRAEVNDSEVDMEVVDGEEVVQNESLRDHPNLGEDDVDEDQAKNMFDFNDISIEQHQDMLISLKQLEPEQSANMLDKNVNVEQIFKCTGKSFTEIEKKESSTTIVDLSMPEPDLDVEFNDIVMKVKTELLAVSSQSDETDDAKLAGDETNSAQDQIYFLDSQVENFQNISFRPNVNSNGSMGIISAGQSGVIDTEAVDRTEVPGLGLSMMMDMEVSGPVSQGTEDGHPSSVNSLDDKDYGEEEVFKTGSVHTVEKISVKDSIQSYEDENGKGSSLNNVEYQPIKSDEQVQLIQETNSQELNNATIQQNIESVDIKEKVHGSINIVLKSLENVELKNTSFHQMAEKSGMLMHIASGDEGTNGIVVSHNHDIVDNSHLIKDITSIQQQSVTVDAVEMHQNVAFHKKESNMEISDPGEQLNQVAAPENGSDNSGEVVDEDFIFGEKEFAKEISYPESLKDQEVAKMDISTDEVQDDIDKIIACFEEDFAKEASNTGPQDEDITLSDRSLPKILLSEKATDQGNNSCKLNVLSGLKDKSTYVLSDARIEREQAVDLSQKESFEDISKSGEDNFNDNASFEDPSSEVMLNLEEKMEPGHMSIGNNELEFVSDLDDKSTTVLSVQGKERDQGSSSFEKESSEEISNLKEDSFISVASFEKESSEVISEPEEKMEHGFVSMENNELEILSYTRQKSTTVVSDQEKERDHAVALFDKESFQDMSNPEKNSFSDVEFFEEKSSETISNPEDKMEPGHVSIENEVCSDLDGKSTTVLYNQEKGMNHTVYLCEKESFEDISNAERDRFRGIGSSEKESLEVISNPEEKTEQWQVSVENNELEVLSDLDEQSATVLSCPGKERDHTVTLFEKKSVQDISNPEEDNFSDVASFEEKSSESVSNPEEKMEPGHMSVVNNELHVLSDFDEKSTTVLSGPEKENQGISLLQKESFENVTNPEEDNLRDVASFEESSLEVIPDSEEKMEPWHVSLEKNEHKIISHVGEKSSTLLSDQGKGNDQTVSLCEKESDVDRFKDITFEMESSEVISNPEEKMEPGHVSIENNVLEVLSNLDEKSTPVLSAEGKEGGQGSSSFEKETFEDISNPKEDNFRNVAYSEEKSSEIISNPEEKTEQEHMSMENNELEFLSALDEKSTTVLSAEGKERGQIIASFEKESFEDVSNPEEDNLKCVTSFEKESSEIISNPGQMMEPEHVSMGNNELEILSDLDEKSTTELSGPEKENQGISLFQKESFENITNPEVDNLRDVASFEESSTAIISNLEEKMEPGHLSLENNELLSVLSVSSDLAEKSTLLSDHGKERNQTVFLCEKESSEDISNAEGDIIYFEMESSDVLSNPEEKIKPGHVSIESNENNELEVLLDLNKKSTTVLSDPGKERDHAVTSFQKASFQDISNLEDDIFRNVASFEEKSSELVSNPEEKMEQGDRFVENNELEFLSDLDEKSRKDEGSGAGLLNDKSPDANKTCSNSISYEKIDEICTEVCQEEAQKSKSFSQLETKDKMKISEDDHGFFDQSNTGDIREGTFQQGCSQDLLENSSQWNVSRIGHTDMIYGLASSDMKSIKNVESVSESGRKRKLSEIFQENAADDDNGPTGVPLKKMLLPTENEHSGKSCSKDEVMKDESVMHMDWYEMESLLEHKTIDTKVCVENDAVDSSGCVISSVQNTDSGKQQFFPENDREIENNHIRRYFPREDQSTLPVDCGGKRSGFIDNVAHDKEATCIKDTVDDSGSSMNLISKTNSNEQQCLSENQLEIDEEFAYGSMVSSKEISDTENHERLQDCTCNGAMNDGDYNMEPPREALRVLSSTREFQIIDMESLSSRVCMADSVAVMSEEDAELSELGSVKGVKLSEIVRDTDSQSSEPASDIDAESSELDPVKGARSSALVGDEDAETSQLGSDKDAELSKLVMDKNIESSELVNDNDVESSELVRDNNVESPELVKEKDAESSEFVSDKVDELSEFVKNKVESSELLNDKDSESSELVLDKDAESSELVMDEDAESSELVVDKNDESSELVIDKSDESSELVMDKNDESSECVSDNDAESSELVKNTDAKSSELVKNKDAESSELVMDKNVGSSELAKNKDAESSELVMDKNVGSSELVKNTDAESSEHIKNKDAELSELVIDKNVGSSELAKNKDAESSELFSDKDAGSSEPLSDDAESSELVMVKSAESSECVSDNDVEFSELVSDNNVGSQKPIKDKDAESSEFVRDTNAESSKLVSDKDAESSELAIDIDAESSEFDMDKNAESSEFDMDKNAESSELIRDKDAESSKLVCDKDSELSEHCSSKTLVSSEYGNSSSVENDLHMNNLCIKDIPESLYYLQDEETTSIIKPCDQSEGSNHDLHTEPAMQPGLITANEKACEKSGCGKDITRDVDEMLVQPDNRDKQGEIMQLTDKSSVLNMKMWQLSEKRKKSETKSVEVASYDEGHFEDLKPCSSPESEPLISLGSDDWDANSEIAMDTTENDTDSTLNDSTLKCLPFISTQVGNENVIPVDQTKESSRCFVWSSNHLDDFSQHHAMSPVIPQQTNIFPKASTADQDELLFSDHSDDDDNGISSLKISALVDEMQKTPIVDEAGSLLEKTHNFSNNLVCSPLEFKKEATSKSPRSGDSIHFNLDVSADDVISDNDDERPVFDRYRDMKEDTVSNVNQSDEENVEDDNVNENEEEHSSGNYGGNIEHIDMEDNENVDENVHRIISNDDNTDNVEEEEGQAIMMMRRKSDCFAGVKRKLKNNDNEYMSSPKKVGWSFIGLDSPIEGQKLEHKYQRHNKSDSSSLDSYGQGQNLSYPDQSDTEAVLSLDAARSPSKYTSVRRQLEYKVKGKSRFQAIKEKLIHLTKDSKEESKASSPLASSSSSQETLGEIPPNRSEHNQFSPVGDHEKVTTLVTRCKSILEKFRQILSLQMDVLQTHRVQALIEELGMIEKWSELPQIVIAVMGNTGDGKSSLMNALLGHSSILPTSGIRACTAAVVEVVQNNGSLYEGCIEFLTKEEWYSELERLIKDLTLSDGNLKKNPPDQGTDQYASYCKVKAVYGKIDRFEVLAGINKVTSHLGQKHNVKCKQAQKFRLQVEKYIETQEPQSGGQFWPIVKRVQLRLPNCDVCKTGAVLVDLPGVRDSNAARDKIARDYLKTCSAIWVVSAIHRAIDDKTAQELLTENFRRQLLMDGQYGSVAFICTKSDQFENSEIIRTLKLQNKCKDHEQKISIMEKKKQRLLEEIKICKKRTHNLNAEMRTSIKECEDLQSLVQEIETQQIDSDQEQSVDYEPMEEAKVLVKEKEKEREKNKEAIKEVTENIYNYERQIQELETQIRQRRRKISHICASARNDYCREKIKQKFQSGLKEIKRQANRLPGVDEDDDDEEEDEDAEEVYRMVTSLRVFCCSSTEYQKMKKLIPADGEATVFNSPEETEIPSLQEYVHELTRTRREQYLERLIRGLGRCIFNFQSYLLDGGTECVKTRTGVKSAIEKYLQDLKSMIQPVLQKMAEDLESTFNDMIQPKFHEGVGQAAQEATDISQKWGSKPSKDPANRRAGGLHWVTYKATIQRLGVYSSPTFGNIDFNEELAAPFSRTITVVWNKVFSSILWKILETVKAGILEQIQHFNRNVSLELQMMGFPVNRIDRIKEQVESSVNFKLTEMVLHLKPLVTAKQRDISRILSPHVQSRLVEIYCAAASQTGKGTFQRMKQEMESGIDARRMYIFDDGSQKMMHELINLKTELVNTVTAVCDMVLEEIKLSFEPLWEDPSQSVLLRDTFQQHVEEVCEKMRTIYRDANLQNTEEHTQTRKKHATTQQPPTLKRPQERKNVIEIVNMFITPVPEELTKMTELEVLKVEKGSNMYPVKDVKQKPGLSSDSGMHNPSDVKGSSGMDVARIKMEVTSEFESLHHYNIQPPVPPSRTAISSDDSINSTFTSMAGPSNVYDFGESSVAKNTQHDQTHTKIRVRAKQTHNSKAHKNVPPEVRIALDNHMVKRSTENSFKHMHSIVSTIAKQHIENSSIAATAQEEAENSSRGSSRVMVILLKPKPGTSATSKEKQLDEISLSHTRQLIPRMTSSTSTIGTSGQAGTSLIQTKGTTSGGTERSSCDIKGNHSSDLKRSAPSVKTSTAQSGIKTSLSDKRGISLPIIEDDDSLPKISVAKRRKKSYREQNNPLYENVQENATCTHGSGRIIQKISTDTSLSTTSVSSGPRLLSYSETESTAISKTQNSEEPGSSNGPQRNRLRVEHSRDTSSSPEMLQITKREPQEVDYLPKRQQSRHKKSPVIIDLTLSDEEW